MNFVYLAIGAGLASTLRKWSISYPKFVIAITGQKSSFDFRIWKL
jgi:hypothetical protein